MTFNVPYFEMNRNTWFQMSFSYDDFIYSLYYLLLVSFQFGYSFVFLPVYMKWFILHIVHIKYILLNMLKISLRKLSGALKASDRGADV